MYVYMYMYIFKMFVDLERNGGKGETSIGCPDWNLNPQHLVYGMMFQPAGAQGVYFQKISCYLVRVAGFHKTSHIFKQNT